MSQTSPIALVFGGSRGIGAACVTALAASGWQVASTYVSRKPDSASGICYAADIRDPAAVARVFDQVEADFGAQPRAVVANAGINVPTEPMAQYSRSISASWW